MQRDGKTKKGLDQDNHRSVLINSIGNYVTNQKFHAQNARTIHMRP